jgi:peptidoglycan-N-acetylglucosamine deacetylase
MTDASTRTTSPCLRDSTMGDARNSVTERAVPRCTGGLGGPGLLMLALVVALLAPSGAAPAPERLTLAVTLDDLPFVGGLGPGDTRPAATARILEALRHHHVPATGFVVCERIDDNPGLLTLWMKSGMELGNHSSSHAHLDAVALDDWTDDVCRCGERLAALTGAPVRWFRYPFLQMGATIARRDSALAVVRRCGHEVAQVSVDTGEWALVKPYVAALAAGDRDRVRAIGDAYIEHLLMAIDHYRDVARQRTGRDVAQVLLLHANALAADSLDALLAAIEARGGRFVSLAEALADSVYRRPDDYAGPIGLSWLYRFHPAADSAWAWDDAQVHALQERFAR